MALTGSYRINFTDPKKGSFVIEPYTVNGTVTATSETLHSKATRADTSLLLYGQYVPNYGEQIQENFVHLLENFCGPTPPTNAVEGQLWYDTGNSYNIVALNMFGGVIEGNHSVEFGQFAAAGTAMVVWYGPATPSDNSYMSLDVKIASYSLNSDGTTNVVLEDTTGNSIQLPASAVGGFMTIKQESGLGRLRVAVLDGSQLVWTDVTNIQCTPTVPHTQTRRVGDIWYDTTKQELKVYQGGDWQSVTKNHLPLSGGIMTGPINMDSFPISYVGPVTVSSTLTPKSYVDGAIAAAVTSASTGTDLQLGELYDRIGAVEVVLPGKMSRDGGNVRNALWFGDDDSTTVLAKGIDMKSLPIINPQITWNATDYLNAATEPNYVINKDYLARALRQHLADVKHVEKGYLLEQPDGTGLIPGNIHFDADYSLSWRRNNTSYTVSVKDHAFVIQSGSGDDDVVELRHGSQPAGITNPSLAVRNNSVESYQTLYLLDGQPQPIAGGGVTDLNDDTAAASKGFVRSTIQSETSGLLPVIGATFDYNGGANTYTLTLDRQGADPVPVDLYHTHRSSTLTYTYTELPNWLGGEEDTVKRVIEEQGIDLGAVPMSAMLTALNQEKAPIQGATFLDLPKIGSSFDVLSVSVAVNGFEINEEAPTLTPGMTVSIVRWDDVLPFTFTGTTVVTEVDPEDPTDITETTFYQVAEPVPIDHDPAINQWKMEFGWVAERSEGPMVVTRTTLDFELDKKENKLLPGTTSQYYRGDKTWVALNKAAVGLGNVDNTSDANKPVSTAVQTALNAKSDLQSVVSLTASATLAAAHRGNLIKVTSATPVTITIPTGLAAGFTCRIIQGGAGQVTVVAGSGVTLFSAVGTKTKAQYSVVTVDNIGGTEYVVSGDAVV